jgi:hypothetical protein
MVTNFRLVFIRLAALTAVTVLTVLLTLTAAASAAGPPDPIIGEPFAISAIAGNNEFDVAAAHDPGRNRFVVVFANDSALNARCIDGHGVTVATFVVPAINGSKPDVVYNGWLDEYLIVWDEALAVWGARVGGVCSPAPGGIGGPFVILPTVADITFGNPAVAHNDHPDHRDYLVVAEGGLAGPVRDNWGIYARRVYSSGRPLGTSYAVTGTLDGPWVREPDVAYNRDRNEYLIVYVQDPSLGVDIQAKDVYGRRLANSGGGGLLPEHAIDDLPFGQTLPAVAAYPLHPSAPYLVVYGDFASGLDKGDVWGRMIGGDGVPLGGFVSIAVDGSKSSGLPAVAGSSAHGGYTVAWSQLGADEDVWVRRVTGDGTVQDGFTVSIPDGVIFGESNETVPAVAGGSPVALVAWRQTKPLATSDIYGRFIGYRPYVPLVVQEF